MTAGVSTEHRAAQLLLEGSRRGGMVEKPSTILDFSHTGIGMGRYYGATESVGGQALLNGQVIDDPLSGGGAYRGGQCWRFWYSFSHFCLASPWDTFGVTRFRGLVTTVRDGSEGR